MIAKSFSYIFLNHGINYIYFLIVIVHYFITKFYRLVGIFDFILISFGLYRSNSLYKGHHYHKN